jgi:hypothetical protein
VIHNSAFLAGRNDIFKDDRLLRVMQAAPPGRKYFGPFMFTHAAHLRQFDQRLRRIHFASIGTSSDLDAIAGLECVEWLSAHGPVDQDLNLPNLHKLTSLAAFNAAVPPTVRLLGDCIQLQPDHDRTDLEHLRYLSAYKNTISLSNLQPFGPTTALRSLNIRSMTLIDSVDAAQNSWPPALRCLRISTVNCSLTLTPTLPSTLEVLEIIGRDLIPTRYRNNRPPRPLEHLDLTHMRGLRRLILRNVGLRSLRSMRLPESLVNLDVSRNDFQTLRGFKFPPGLSQIVCYQTPRLRLQGVPSLPGCDIRY